MARRLLLVPHSSPPLCLPPQRRTPLRPTALVAGGVLTQRRKARMNKLMRLEPTPDNLYRMFMNGGEHLTTRPWEASERAWVWSLRYLCWRYLMYAITDDWTPT